VVNLQEELRRLELEQTAIRSADPAKISVGGGGRQEDALLSNIVRRQETENRLARAQSWVAQVKRGLEVLEYEQRLILSRCYINPEKCAVDSLCYDLGAEKSTVYRKRDKALHTFTTALYGIEG
jgi:hypothetical protein